jgi:hypothetical protein
MSASADSRTLLTKMHSHLKHARTQAKRLGRSIEWNQLREQEAEHRRKLDTANFFGIIPIATRPRFGYEVKIRDQSTGFVLISMALTRTRSL